MHLSSSARSKNVSDHTHKPSHNVEGENNRLSHVDYLDELARGFMRTKAALVNSKRVKFKDFRYNLRARYGVVWAEFLAGHTALVVIVAGLIAVRSQPLALVVIAGLVGAVLVGYVFHYLSLFQHAAAHFNLAADKRLNDFLANIFVGLLFGYDIKLYRVMHFDHHRNLGTPADTENDYILPFNWRFFLRSATGLTMLNKFFDRGKLPAQHVSGQKTARRLGPLSAVAALVHSVIVLSALYFSHYALAVAWVFGVIDFFPLFMGIRLTLEHRSPDAKADVDYSQQAHGAFSRMFGSGPIASTFGAAGFNRHLLHHWEPQVPYERLKDLEKFLRDTELAPVLDEWTTSYATAFRQLFGR